MKMKKILEGGLSILMVLFMKVIGNGTYLMVRVGMSNLMESDTKEVGNLEYIQDMGLNTIQMEQNSRDRMKTGLEMGMDS